MFFSIEVKSISNRIGKGVKVYVKYDGLNPTGSFKDRGSATLINAAFNESVLEFVEDSSGNAGASIAAYAAKAGMNSHIFVPKNTPQVKIF